LWWFAPHAEMTMHDVMLERTAGLGRGCAGIHAEKFLTEMCLKVFWSRRVENLTENLREVNFSKKTWN